MVSNVDDEGIRYVLDIIPMVIPEHLEALNFIRYEDGDCGHVGVGHHPEGEVGAGTWWIVVYLHQINGVFAAHSRLQFPLLQP